MKKRNSRYILLALFFTFPSFVFAQISISEIMYDLEGTDTDREWVEIFNNGSEAIDLSGFKFDDGATSKHGLNVPPKNGGQGSMTIPAGEYAVLTQNASVFLGEHLGYSGTVIDTVVDLANTTDTIAVIDASGNVVDTMAYDKSMGAPGDGNSLQFLNSVWVASVPTPGEANVATVLPNSNPPNSDASIPTSETQTTPSTSGSAWKTDPQIYPNAGADRTVLVGAEVLFNGSALGVKKEPLPNARFLWNFGDGATKEGKNVLHIFRQPGEYVVTLDASSGEYSQGDSAIVTAVPAAIRIGLFESGSEGFVEIVNGGRVDIDISGFKIKVATTTFAFPKGTIIRGGKSVRFSNEVTNLNQNSSPQLQYPNGNPLLSTGEVKAVLSTNTVQTIKASDAKVAIPATIQKPKTLAQVSSFDNEDSNGDTKNNNSKSSYPLTPWAIGLVSLVGIASAGVLFLRRPHDPADEYEIVE